MTYDPADLAWARFWCRDCQDYRSIFKRSFRNPQRGLCVECEDKQPLSVEDVDE